MASSHLKPLYNLERKDVLFEWSPKCEESFKNAKELLQKSEILVHYNPTLPIIIATDASPYGVGAVMSHLVNGEERPIMFISSTLTKSEQNYAQIQKEALAILFGVRKLHKYIYGRRFTLVTDHLPLKTIFNPKKNIPTMAASRLQRWALELSAYEYDIQYRKGENLAHADAMSRLPSPELFEEPVYFFNTFFEGPLSAEDISKSIRKDQVLTRVYDYTLRGWPEKVEQPSLKPYFPRQTELSLENQIVLWGNRVIIPYDLRTQVLELLHDQHIGMVRMKLLAHSEVWWPNIDDDIENFVRKCEPCQIHQESLPKVPYSPWPKQEKNWQRLHIDFLELNSLHFLLIVDSTSKWLDLHLMNGTNAERTVEKLRSSFAIFGIPFNGNEYKHFCVQNGIRCILTPPLHPNSNGMAERQVHTIKQNLRKQIHEMENKRTKMNIQYLIDNFLFKYRTTPHSVTGVSPAEKMLKQLPRTRLTMLRKNRENRQEKQERKIKERIDKRRGKMREFEKGEEVLVLIEKNNKRATWDKGQIFDRISAVTYLVWLENARKMRYLHADVMKRSFLDEDNLDISQLPTTFANGNSTEKDIVDVIPDLNSTEKDIVDVLPDVNIAEHQAPKISN